ncbi:MAG: DnaA/Hda family protein [Candidatus Poseidoniales archaeon]
MTPPPTKLRAELEEAKQHLRNAIDSANSPPSEETTSPSRPPAGRPALSKLNTLLGTTVVPERPLALHQRVGVAQRPTYDLIADRVLGPDVGRPTSFLDVEDSYASHVAHRLTQLRQRLETQPLPEDTASTSAFVGVEDDGTPVWSQVLDEQRGRASATLRAELAPPQMEDASHPTRLLNIAPAWPKRMPWSTSSTFKQWFVAEENLDATRCCEHVIDRPAGGLNPLMVVASPQAGCSHLLHATGQALLRRDEGHVLWLTAADASTVDGLEADWQEGLVGASAVLVDDVDAFAHHEVWRHQLGLLLDHALNLGVQVVVGSHEAVETFPSSRLNDVLRQATATVLSVPSVASLMAFGRWRSTQRNLLVSDQHLAQLSRMEPTGWRAMEHRLERLSMAFEQGAVLLDHDDATALVQGQQPVRVAREEQQRVDDLAAQLVGEAMDSVYTTMDIGGVDLHSPLDAWPEDDYEPPSWSEEQLGDGSGALERRLRAAVDPVEPGRPSVLDVNEREKYIVRANDPLQGGDLGRAVDVLVDLDATIDERMNASTTSAVASSLELQRLEERMVVLAQRAVEADIEELITIADELRNLEERLVELDPDRAPLPPFEDASSGQRRAPKRRTPGRRRPSAEAEKSDSLDAYEPDGDWNIDGTGIEASDLLEDEPAGRVVHLARLHPRTVLVGEEE